MKLTAIILLTACLQVSAKSYSQITISENNVSLQKVFKQIQKQSGYDFLYSSELLQQVGKVSIDVKNASVEQAMTLCLKDKPLVYSILDKTIVIKPKEIKLSNAINIVDAAAVIEVKGIVVNENGKPLSNVAVLDKKSLHGVFTDEEGKFLIKSTVGSLLEFSYVGYEKQQIKVSTEHPVVVIKLQTLMKEIESMVVIGYGQTDRKKLIGSVGEYKPNNIGANSLTVGEMLQGRIAGVQVNTASGVPGAATAITIRGVSTLSNGGNSPLIVIDGVPAYGIDNSNNTTNAYNQLPGFAFFSPGSTGISGYSPSPSFERSPLATLNPDDIESIAVLKDAYATAIYGSRAAAGVILITTKKGKAGKPVVNLQYSTNVQQAFGRPQVMTGDQYAQFYNSLLDTLRRNPPTPFWPGILPYFKSGINTNWLDQILRNGIGYDANASISGGNDRTKYFISGGYNSQQSYIIGNDFNRAQARLNLEQKFTENFKMGASIGLSATKNNALNAQSMYYNAVTTAPNVPIKDSLGNYSWRAVPYTFNGYTTPAYASYGSSQDINPVGTANTSPNYITDNRTIGNIFAELKLTSWLNIRSEFGIDWLNSRAYNRVINKVGTPGGAALETYGLNKKYVVNNLLNFNKTFGKHQLTAMLGQSFEKSIEGTTSIQGTGFLNDQILSIASATTRNVAADIQQSWALFSVFGRVDYTYNNKYMLGVTHRIDGSSRFAYNNRYLQFPSFSTGWIISHEDFMKSLKWVNELKIRGGIGFTGTDGGGGYYGYQGQYTFNGNNSVNINTYGNITTLQASTPANPNLKWQHTRNIDAGLDAKLFNNKVTITVDYYNKYTTNLLASAPLPGFMGFSSQQQNLGEMRNSGYEISIETKNIETKNFKWTTSFNIARNTNVITKLYQTDSLRAAVNNQLSNGRIWLPGQSATAFYLYQWGGVNPANGNPVWIGSDKTTNETPFEVQYTGMVNSALLVNRQRVNRGDALPKFFGGIDNRFQWKNFDLSFFITYAYGNKVFNGVKAALYNYTSSNAQNLSPDMLNYWKKAGDITNIPSLMNQSSIAKLSSGAFQTFDYTIQRTSDRFLEDGSFIRLKNITLAYNLPATMLKRFGITGSSIKIFGEANNVFIITRYSGIDPEVSAYGSSALAAGFDEITMPNPRTYRFGLKVGL